MLIFILDLSNQSGEYIKKVGFNYVIVPIIYVTNAPNYLYLKIKRTFQSKDALRKRIAELEKEKRRNLFFLDRYTALKYENKHLKKLLHSLKSSNLNLNYLVAHTIYSGATSSSEEIFINVGKDAGVYKEQIVSDDFGLVGLVVDVYNSISRVMLILHPKNAIPVEIPRTGLLAVSKGQGKGKNLIIDYLPVDSDIRSNDLVITSGLGGRYPRGIPVARIVSSENNHKNNLTITTAKPIAKINYTLPLLLLGTN